MRTLWVLLLLVVVGASVGAWGQQSFGPPEPNVISCKALIPTSKKDPDIVSFNAAVPLSIIATALEITQPEVAAALALVSVSLNVRIGPVNDTEISTQCSCDTPCPGGSSISTTLFLTKTIDIGADTLFSGQPSKTVSFTVAASGTNQDRGTLINNPTPRKLNGWEASFRASSTKGINLGPIKFEVSAAVAAALQNQGTGAKVGIGKAIAFGSSVGSAQPSISCQCLTLQPISNFPKECRGAPPPTLAAPSVIIAGLGDTEVSVPVTVSGVQLKDVSGAFGDIYSLENAETDPKTGLQTATVIIKLPVFKGDEEFSIRARNKCGQENIATVRVLRRDTPVVTMSKSQDRNKIFVVINARIRVLRSQIETLFDLGADRVTVSSDATDEVQVITPLFIDPGAGNETEIVLGFEQQFLLTIDPDLFKGEKTASKVIMVKATVEGIFDKTIRINMPFTVYNQFQSSNTTISFCGQKTSLHQVPQGIDRVRATEKYCPNQKAAPDTFCGEPTTTVLDPTLKAAAEAIECPVVLEQADTSPPVAQIDGSTVLVQGAENPFELVVQDADGDVVDCTLSAGQGQAELTSSFGQRLNDGLHMLMTPAFRRAPFFYRADTFDGTGFDDTITADCTDSAGLSASAAIDVRLNSIPRAQAQSATLDEDSPQSLLLNASTSKVHAANNLDAGLILEQKSATLQDKSGALFDIKLEK